MGAVTLDDYEVYHVTERAVLLLDLQSKTGEKTWVPRSVCDAGDRLMLHERDVVVQEWFAEKEGLRY